MASRLHTLPTSKRAQSTLQRASLAGELFSLLVICSLELPYELSHKMVQTEDISYDYQGLKPGASVTPAEAIKNADSWAYFGADIVGVLSQATKNDVLK